MTSPITHFSAQLTWRTIFKNLRFPASIYLLKVNNRNIKTMCNFWSNLIAKTPERRPLVFFLLTLNRFHTLSCCFHCWFWTSKYRLGFFRSESSDIRIKCEKISVLQYFAQCTLLSLLSVLIKFSNLVGKYFCKVNSKDTRTIISFLLTLIKH